MAFTSTVASRGVHLPAAAVMAAPGEYVIFTPHNLIVQVIVNSELAEAVVAPHKHLSDAIQCHRVPRTRRHIHSLPRHLVAFRTSLLGSRQRRQETSGPNGHPRSVTLAPHPGPEPPGPARFADRQQTVDPTFNVLPCRLQQLAAG